jgi:predicted DNA-binding transcriptional regulator YafY
MRGDRLLAALLVLQRRGKVSAPQLAVELEVSVKTARRDLEALAQAGVPVYSLPGRQGGWQLVGGARTDLSGLTETEAKTLFFLVGPTAEASSEARSALRKLLQALPEPFREGAWASSSSVVFDAAAWGGRASPEPPRLEPLRRAIAAGRQVELVYTDRAGRRSSRTASPLGLVKKDQAWYLLANTTAGRRTFHVNRVQAIVLSDAPVERIPGFDLASEWRSVAARVNALRRGVEARLRARREQLEPLRYQFGDDLRVDRECPNGEAVVIVSGSSVTALAQQLAGWGGAIEVLGPAALRRELVHIGHELVRHHGGDEPPS